MTSVGMCINESNFTLGNRSLRQGDLSNAEKFFNLALKENLPSKVNSLIEFNLKLVRLKLDACSSTRDQSISRLSDQEGRYQGNVDLVFYSSSYVLIEGWCIEKANYSALFELFIYIDHIQICCTYNDVDRFDLVKAGISDGYGGFSIQIPRNLILEFSGKIDIRLSNGELVFTTLLSGLDFPVKCMPNYQRQPPSLSYLPCCHSVLIFLCINSYRDFLAFIEKLPKTANENIVILLLTESINSNLNEECFEAVNNCKNIVGQIIGQEQNVLATVNSVIAEYPNLDVLFLNDDVEFGPRWLEGFQRAASIDSSIATVSPYSECAYRNLTRSDFDFDLTIAPQAFRRYSQGLYPSIPIPLIDAGCVYIRRSALKALGGLPEVSSTGSAGNILEESIKQFAMSASEQGYHHILDDRTLIKSRVSGRDLGIDQFSVSEEISKSFEQFRNSSACQNIASIYRYASAVTAQEMILPRVLFVISTQTGGTPQTNQDLMKALSNQIEPWLLQCDLQQMSLSCLQNGKLHLIHQHHFDGEPVNPITHDSPEYNRVIWQWLSEYDFSTVHIRHLGWHGLSLPRFAKEQGARVVYSFHDFYSICPSVKLLDSQSRYCAGDCSLSKSDHEQDCGVELWPQDSFPTLKGQWVHRWREKFNQALQWCDQFVTTHDSVRDTLLQYLNLDHQKFMVIPHGRDFKVLDNLAAPYEMGQPLRILLLGTIHLSKGTEIVRKLLEIDTKGLLELHILGESDINWSHPRLIIHGAYQREEIADRISAIAPHIGAVFSIWNETWCHTLTELWSVGLPVLALDYPTIGQRVRSSGAGWLIDREVLEQMTDSHDLFNTIIASLDSVKSQLQSLHKNGSISDSVEQMAQQYMSLYQLSQ